jgi:putative peptidoglycan lipid II flippase
MMARGPASNTARNATQGVALASLVVKKSPETGNASAVVAVAMLLSRVAGLITFRMFGHYFGLSDSADAFRAAIRIPSFLQNLFGEGVMSASFIPVYARLRAEQRDEDAIQVALSVFALLCFCTSILVVLGIAATPWLIDGIAPGFHGAKRELTIRLVRICFPGVGLLVFSAWCLGVLTSHGKFFLAYAAPALGNLAMIAAFLWYGRRAGGERLVEIIMWASVAGSGLQFVAQLPFVFRLLQPARFQLFVFGPHVRTILKNFVPTFVARGVTQISMYITALLASLLPMGGVAALTTALTLYLLPLSLFGASVYATELPAMSSVLGNKDQVAQIISGRLARAVHEVAFFVVPSAAAFMLLGKVVVAALFQTGAFGANDVIYVWGVLAGSSVGLVAEATGRVYFSAFYALGDTRTPLKVAIIRVAMTIVLGYSLAIPLPPLLGIDPKWGAAGLTLAVGMTAWLELALLRQALQHKIGVIPSSTAQILNLWIAAAAAAIAGQAILRYLPTFHPSLTGFIVLICYSAVYLLLTHIMGTSSLSAAWTKKRK